MPEEKKKKIHLFYAIALGALTVIVGALFIISCISIYKSGERPFTRDSIGEAFYKIAAPVFIFIAAIIGGAVLNIALPLGKKFRSSPNEDYTLKILRKKCPIESVSKARGEAIAKERKKRAILIISSVIFYTGMLIYPIIYVFSTKNFPAADINAEILTAVVTILGFLALPFASTLVISYVFKASKIKEAEEIKAAISECKSGAVTDFYVTRDTSFAKFLKKLHNFFSENKKTLLFDFKVIIILVGILFIILGILNGGVGDVLQKAVRICTECIGMG